MGDYRQDRGNRSSYNSGSGGGRSSFGRNSGGGRDRDRGPVTMHQAVCDECGKNCEVPFRPTEGKPVYCSDCFGSKRDSGGGRDRDRAPQRFTPSQPSFGAGSGGNKGNNDEVNKQLVLLTEKMDKLINMVDRVIGVKEAKPSVEKKEKAEVKPEKAVKVKKEVKSAKVVKPTKVAKKVVKKKK